LDIEKPCNCRVFCCFYYYVGMECNSALSVYYT